MKIANLLVVILQLFFTIPIQSSPSLPHFLKSINYPRYETNAIPLQRYFEVTHPHPTDDITPACSVSVLDDSVGVHYGSPPVTVDYTPPPQTCEWSIAVLEFRAECKREHYDRIAGVWIDGVELLRTSTAQPIEDGIFWIVRKDVTRYSSIISQSDLTLSVMLENIVNDEFTGVYHVNISFHFYADVNKTVRFPISMISGESEAHTPNRKLISLKSHENGRKLDGDQGFRSLYSYDKPADLIIPISAADGLNEGFWFRIEHEFDVQTKVVQIPQRTYRAVLELYASFHGNGEFWYMNPFYVETNHLCTGRAHEAYREVLVTIDRRLVGAVVPIPVTFTGRINRLYWEPVVSIGAFDLPSYDVDFTPFLGLLLDNKDHSIGIQIADGVSISFWFVDANLHLWLDDSYVPSRSLKSRVPSMKIQRKDQFVRLDSEFEIEREKEVIGWLDSSTRNLKPILTNKIKLKNKLKFKDEGSKKELHHRYKMKINMKTTNENGKVIERLKVKLNYPMEIETETKPELDEGTLVMTTKLEQEPSKRYYGDNGFEGFES